VTAQSSTAPQTRVSAKAVALLAASLALAAADQTIVGAVAPDLKVELDVGNTQIGLLVTAAYILAAIGTVPFGILADRTRRVRLLAICALEWSLSITLAGFADTYGALLVAQLALGAGVGAAAPLVASLAGDIFTPAVRGRALGFILAGEFAGAASGLLIAGEIAAFAPWRYSFWALALLGPVLAVALLTRLPEPARGAQAAGDRGSIRDAAGDRGSIRDAAGDRGSIRDAAGDGAATPEVTGDRAATPDAGGPVARAEHGLAAAIRAAGIRPRDRLVLHEDPTGKPLAWAVRYVLAVPTNVVIIVTSALCYFYVAGVQTFAIVYLRGRFDASQELATVLLVVIGIGVIAGILATGHLSDRLIARGHLAARIGVGAVCFVVAILAFAPGFLVGSLALALPLLFLGAAGLGGLNPPLDAARLDVVHFRLWGRAESVRAMCQNLIRASAPLIFGWLSVLLAAPDEVHDVAQGGGAVGLGRAFLVLLGLFAVAGGVLAFARRGYLRDVATAAASERAAQHAADDA
jgi:MFS family permease